MAIGSYTVNRNGDQVYQSYNPAPLPIGYAVSKKQQNVLTFLHERIRALDERLNNAPIRDAFITNQIRREALASSIIEGIHSDWLTMILGSSVKKSSALDAVGNMDAIVHAYQQQALPLSNRLIRDLHAKLLSLRDHSRVTPGEFRRSQNWIGPSGCTLQSASFVPPNTTDMTEAMENLEKYLHCEDDSTDSIIRAALAHYQFETIHPFLDGNGRIGRLLVNQQLINEGVIGAPYIALSPYLLKHRDHYYQKLTSVRISNSYNDWIDFFLSVMDEAVASAYEIFEVVLSNYDASVRIIRENFGTRKQKTSIEILNCLVRNFMSSTRSIAENTSISRDVIRLYMKRFDELGIVDYYSLTRNISCYIRDCDLDLWVMRELDLFGNRSSYQGFPLHL